MWAVSLAGARLAHSASGLDALGDLVSSRSSNEDDLCPECGAELAEWGALGCCDALTADCVGNVDGVSGEEFDFEADPSGWDRLVRHSWYVDTGEPAPREWNLSARHVGAVAKCAWKCGAAGRYGGSAEAPRIA